MTKLLYLALPAGIVLAANPALAEEPVSYPQFSGEAVFELQSESGVSSDDPDNERHNIFMRSEVAPRLQFNENFFIDGVAVLEPTRTSSPGDDTFFENEGVFIEEIKLNYENGPFAAFGGKFNPGFGIAWDYGRGIWSEEFAEDYEITEKIGFGLAYTLETESFGSYTLTGSTFFADTSFLAESGITGRDQLHLSDGGASNTEDLSSFVLSLDSESLAGIENLSYHFAFRHLAEGSASSGGADEQGFATNLRYVIPFSDALQSDVLLEYAGLCNVDGGTEDSRYYTASVVNKIYENWNLTVGFTNRIMTMAGSPDIDDHLLQLTAGYDFGNGLTLEAGWRNSNEAGTANNILGGLARYTFEF